MLRDAVFAFQLDCVRACFSISKFAFSWECLLTFYGVSLHFLSGLTQFLVDLLQRFVPVWLVVIRLPVGINFHCFEDCRVKLQAFLLTLCLEKVIDLVYMSVSSLKRFQPTFL